MPETFIHRMLRRALLAACIVGSTAAAASACPVCFGDPESDMVQGAASGVLFMVILTYVVLMGMVGFAAFWFVRARRLRANVTTGTREP